MLGLRTHSAERRLIQRVPTFLGIDSLTSIKGNSMLIQVNTDNHIKGREALVAQVESTVESNLRHFQNHITRVEVHLTDENSQKGGAKDKRCMMEARIEGRQPLAVSHEAESLTQAVDGAAKKLKASLATALGRLNGH